MKKKPGLEITIFMFSSDQIMRLFADLKLSWVTFFNSFEKNCYSSIAILINCQTRRNGDKYYGQYIGKFPGTTHGVKGEVYAVNKNTIYIREFSYDGAGPGMCSTLTIIS